MVSPGWVAAGVSIAGVLIAWGGAWALVKYRLQQVEKSQAEEKQRAKAAQQKNESSGAALSDRLAHAIEDFRKTIRDEFDRATEKINRLLFEEGGTTRYLPRGEYEKERRECRADLVRRIERLEGKTHEHGK